MHMWVCILSHVQLSATLWTFNLPGSSVHGMFQARILEWVAISFSRGSSTPRIEPGSPALAAGFFTTDSPWEAVRCWSSFIGLSDGKESACKAGDPGSIATHSSIVGESCGQRSLEGCIVHGVAKGRTLLKQLIHTHTQSLS